MRTTMLMSALALVAGPAFAQAVPPTAGPMSTTGPMAAGQLPCPTPAALPPELAGWTAAVPVKAAVSGEPATATIEPGRGVRATLSPVDQLRYPVAPGHAGEPGTTGGLLAFAVSRAGTYRVALGAGAWIDVVRDGRALVSIAHGRGPACSPIRKTVDFTLAPGRYLLEVSGNATPVLALMIAPIAS
ncbi:homogentisate 1,2-dioxygenase [Sphingomonas bacterium]|uniref:homogentisate 1,2-dioxygenase n=1 Tax=Sphingomonas bacterium TaxID=1895847 RepID=UPI001576FFDF|nr:homogentisate 1,2-dioxygenase [Sphingomonas bacterium]